jgi:DNA-binding response OmpR family regulator
MHTQRNNLSVLLVDDDELVLCANAAHLEFAGFDVHIATDGPAALKAISTWQPFAAIVDIRMPDCDGLAIARRVREEMGYNGLLIALTSLSTKLDELASLSAGFNRHVVKPADIDHVVDYIESFLH